MYQGLLRRFRRSGNFKWVKADVVREGEEFAHYIDEAGEHFRHVPGDSFRCSDRQSLCAGNDERWRRVRQRHVNRRGQ